MQVMLLLCIVLALQMCPSLKKTCNEKSHVDYGWSRYRFILIGCRLQFECHLNLTSEHIRPVISVAKKIRGYIHIYEGGPIST